MWGNSVSSSAYQEEARRRSKGIRGMQPIFKWRPNSLGRFTVLIRTVLSSSRRHPVSHIDVKAVPFSTRREIVGCQRSRVCDVTTTTYLQSGRESGML